MSDEEKLNKLVDEVGKIRVDIATLNTNINKSLEFRLDKLEKKEEANQRLIIGTMLGLIIDIFMRLVSNAGL